MNLLPALGLGAVTGMRSMMGLAFFSDRAEEDKTNHDNPAMQFLSSPRTAALLKIFAMGEVLMDKLPFTPDRTDAAPLIGRVVLGGLVGAAVSKDNWIQGGAVGAIGALAATYAAHYISKSLHDYMIYGPVYVGDLQRESLAATAAVHHQVVEQPFAFQRLGPYLAQTVRKPCITQRELARLHRLRHIGHPQGRFVVQRLRRRLRALVFPVLHFPRCRVGGRPRFLERLARVVERDLLELQRAWIAVTWHDALSSRRQPTLRCYAAAIATARRSISASEYTGVVTAFTATDAPVSRSYAARVRLKKREAATVALHRRAVS